MSLKLELCSSTEWLTLRGYIDYDGDDLDHEEAVAFRRRLEAAIRKRFPSAACDVSSGSRSTLHGWDGCRTGDTLGPVRSQEKLTLVQWFRVGAAIAEATHLADRYRVVKSGSLEVLSECDTWEQAVRCADESESCETRPEVYIERRVGGKWVGVKG